MIARCIIFILMAVVLQAAERPTFVEAMQAAVRGAASDATGAAREALLQLMRVVHAANPKLAQAITRTRTPYP